MKAYLAYYLNKDYSRYYIADAENCYKNNSVSIAWDEHRPELFDFAVDIKQLNKRIAEIVEKQSKTRKELDEIGLAKYTR